MPQVSAQQQQVNPAPEIRLVGPEPQRFTVAPGQLATVAGAAFGSLVRVGSGGFVSGYQSSLVEEDGRYAVASAGGRKLRESSLLLAAFPRPAKPITLYEFEVGAEG